MNEAERFLRNAQTRATQANQPAPTPAAAPTPAPAPAPAPQPQQPWGQPQMPPQQQPWGQAPQPQMQPPPQQPWAQPQDWPQQQQPWGQAPQPQMQPPPQQAWAQPQDWPQQPAYPQGWQQPEMSQGEQKMVSMGTAWYNFWTQWTFDGRSSRSEYWFAYVILCLFSILGAIILVVGRIPIGICVLGVLSIFPWWFLSVRRLHDIGRSGWCLLLAIIVPVIGLIWMCTKSDPLPNKYGPVPNVE